MPRPSRSRKPTPRAVAFKAAVAWARTTVTAFCRDHDITPGHLYKVLSGERESPVLVEKVDAFIATHTPPAPASSVA